MNLFIPACGDRLQLTSDWEFPLYLESRNIKFAKAYKLVGDQTSSWGVWDSAGRTTYRTVQARIQAGAVLECDRVYIRTFSKNREFNEVAKDFDSITWKLMKNDKPVRNCRFWTKLPDCYSIEYELAPNALYRDRVKLVRSVIES